MDGSNRYPALFICLFIYSFGFVRFVRSFVLFIRGQGLVGSACKREMSRLAYVHVCMYCAKRLRWTRPALASYLMARHDSREPPCTFI